MNPVSIVKLAILVLFLNSLQQPASAQNVSSVKVGKPFKVVDASPLGSNYAYTYGPSIIFSEGKYHAYYCSTGAGSYDWDHIRYSQSKDLIHWTSPDSIVQSTRYERAACDPSVVRFNAGDGLYYYMMFSGNVLDVQTVNFLARSKNPSGPFYRYTDRKTWEQNPHDSKVMVWPKKAAAEGSNIYGAGQASLVVVGDTVYQWYTDTTITGKNLILMNKSKDMIHWTSAVQTNAETSSIDVKYDDENQNFVMIEILNQHTDHTALSYRRSQDGVKWTSSQIISDEDHFPKWTNNVGMSGDEKGHLIGNKALVAYGAPFDLSPQYINNDCNISPSPYCWGHWDLFGQIVSF